MVRRVVGVVWGCRLGVPAAVVVLEEEDSAGCATACRCCPAEPSLPLELSSSLTEPPERWPADLSSLRTRDSGRPADRARLARVCATDDLHDAFGQIRDRSPDSASGAPAGERLEADSRWLTSEAGSAHADALPRRPKRSWQAAPLGRPGSELNVRPKCPEVDRLKRPVGDWLLCRLPSRWMTGLARWPTAGGSERSSTG